jgi:hypothetical protein
MNWPTPKFAALPISLHASFDHFDGTPNIFYFTFRGERGGREGGKKRREKDNTGLFFFFFFFTLNN